MSDNFWSTYFAIKAAHESLEREKYLRDNNLTKKEANKLYRKAKLERRVAKMESFANKLNCTADKINASNERLKKKWFGKQ